MQQYYGPSNYWTEHTLVPGERYTYGYYGFYSPLVNPKYYRNITNDMNEIKKEPEKKCNSCNGTLIWAVIIVLMLILFGKFNR